MIIISEYILKYNEDSGDFLVESSDSSQSCPICGGTLAYRDSRKRIRRKEGGEKHTLIIRRLKCSKCGKLHTELPDCLVPYKHYETEVISGVIEGIVTPYDEDSEDYPSEETMRRWLKWFLLIRPIIDGWLRSIADWILKLGKDILSSESLLDSIMNIYKDSWMEIIHRVIYNSGGSLPSLASILNPGRYA